MSSDVVGKVRFGGGFGESDRELVGDTLAQALGRFDQLDPSWEMELSVKDREAPGQTVTLEAWVPGKKRLVATSREPDLRAALNDVSADLRRQLTKARELASPRDNRAKRDTIRGH
ncbi:MAG TPA: hypothetical protein PLU83_14080 [Phycicoccus sp.]|nr:hypothetical protein [Phycicoccus sp.]